MIPITTGKLSYIVSDGLISGGIVNGRQRKICYFIYAYSEWQLSLLLPYPGQYTVAETGW
jgi:hypothetical protein